MIGITGIVVSAVVAVAADRLAHRRRLAAMNMAFERAITLPISYHSERGTGTVIRTIVEGTSALFGTWLSFMREQCTAMVAVVCLIPVAFWMEWRLAALLSLLALIYVALNNLVIRKTSGGTDLTVDSVEIVSDTQILITLDAAPAGAVLLELPESMPLEP